ncbi:UNVERIFIED_CONTAM: hypothetical protein FKN15_007149 [Acipenser sinensis]
MHGGEFLITPLPQRLAVEHNYTSLPGHHPHVLYKRSAEHTIHRRPADSSSYQGHHYLPHGHLHKRDYLHRKYQRQHFCGRRKKYTPKPPAGDLHIAPDEYEQQSRAKRSPLNPRKPTGLNVETLVVADRKMVEKHGKENITTYVLTVMNMVSSLFKDGTIGKDINIVVVSLLLLEQDPVGLSISHHADLSLNSFCQWQSGLIGKNGKRHDHAVLLTGLDICSWKNEPCDTLGFAPISGMCSKYRSCTINEDTGLGLAFTIAHESGHNFGMIHDGEGNVCKKAEGNIMSPTLAGNNGVFSWSACSRQYLNRFLSTAQASCLVDEPKQVGQYRYPDKLPGQLYDADTQCKWQFGSKAKLCNLDFVKDICKSLWCHRTGNRCETKFMPAAEGTICGQNMSYQALEEHPYFIGYPWLCKKNKNKNSNNNHLFSFLVEDICKLYCIAEDFEFFFAMSSKVKDGTSCSDDMHNVCIDGICEPVGCDQVLGSKAALDACGVCEGDNSTCTFFKGQYLQQHRANEYYSVVTIPAGVRSIRVHEMEISTSYLAVRSLKKKYYLTGDWTVDWPGQFPFAGTVFDYQRSFNRPESLYAAGPTNETLVFEILLQGKNPGIAWEYTLPKSLNDSKTTAKKHNYTWVAVRSDCSASCAGGQMSIKAVCLQDHYTQVNSSFCNPRTRPTIGTNVCNTQPCPAFWSAGEWSTCSKSCGLGQQSRQIQCLRKVAFKREEVVAHSQCPVMTPAQGQPCNNKACLPEWSAGAWSECSKTCGRGLKKRSVYCSSTNLSNKPSILPDSTCSRDQKPKAQETCVLRRCPKNDRLEWVTSAWSECSTSCGPGVQKRELKCSEKDDHGKYIEFPQRRCRNLQKPIVELEQACNKGSCSGPRPPPERTISMVVSGWYSSPWQQCTVSCGGGVQTRSVQCLRQGRPSDDPSCIDFFSWCHLVLQHGVCNHKFYGQQCCKSCTRKMR